MRGRTPLLIQRLDSLHPLIDIWSREGDRIFLFTNYRHLYREFFRTWHNYRIVCSWEYFESSWRFGSFFLDRVTVLGAWKPWDCDILPHPFEQRPQCSWLGVVCWFLGALLILLVPTSLCLWLLDLLAIRLLVQFGHFYVGR